MKRPVAVWVVVIGGILALATLFGVGGWLAYQRFEKRSHEERERKERDLDTEKKLTPDSTRDATEDLVDDDFKVRLVWPGTGYKVMAEEDARRIVPEAIGGVMGTGGPAPCSLAVTAEHLPDTTPEQAARLYIEAITANDKVVRRFEPGEFQGHPAVFFDVSGSIEGLSIDWYDVVVVRDGWAIRAMAWTNPIRPAPCDGFLAKNLRLLPGKVAGRVRKTRLEDEVHAAYRLDHRRFEVPFAGMAVDVPEDVDLLFGDRLFAIDPEGLFALVRQSVHVIVRVTDLRGADPARFPRDLVEGVAPALGGLDPAAAPLRVDVVGRSVELRKIDGPQTFETWIGTSLENDREITVRFLFPKALGEHALDSARAMLALVKPMTDAEASRVAGELPKAELLRSTRVGRALRGGALLDFRAGARFTIPEGPSVVSLEPALFGLGPEVSIMMLRPDLGLSAAIVTHPASDAVAEDQRAVLSALVHLPPAELQLVPAQAVGATRVTADYLTVSHVPSRYDLHTLSRGNVRLHLAVWGPTANVDRAQGTIAGWARGLSMAEHGLVEETVTATRIENLRFGFAFDLPGDGWTVKPMSIGGMGGSSTVFAAYQAESSRGSIAIMAIDPGQTGDPKMFEQLIEQGVAKPGASGSPDRREEIELGGRRVRHLVWGTGMEAIFFHEGTTIFAVVVEPLSLGGLTPRAVFDAVRVLP